jgi:hypothetical protein
MKSVEIKCESQVDFGETAAILEKVLDAVDKQPGAVVMGVLINAIAVVCADLGFIPTNLDATLREVMRTRAQIGEVPATTGKGGAA